jgi:futalosine hydrolase
MQILIVSATKLEIKGLLDQMESSNALNDSLYICKYKNLAVHCLITGVGMVATTYAVAKTLNPSYDFVMNVGVCGSFNRNLEIGTVVNVYEDTFAELGAEDGDKFLSLTDMKLEGTTKITNNHRMSNPKIEVLPKVTGITVNMVHGNEASIEKVFNRCFPYVESMEGAAFMYVCEQEKIPYVQIRAISNMVERRNRSNWDISFALKNLNKKMLEIMNSFK